MASKLEFWDCNGTAAQDWIWSSDQTIRPAANTQLCIDVNQGDYSDGSKIQLWTCNGGPNQKWGPPGGFSTTYPPAPPSSNGGIAVFGKTWEQQTPSVKTNPFASPQCTWGVMNWVHFYTQDWFLDGDWGVYPYVLGDAWQWRDQAIAAGWAVITDYTQPQVNSILVLQPNVGGAYGAGHVGWVTSVNNNGTITFNSTNWAGSGDAVVPATVKLQPGMSYILIPGPPSAGH
jgi:surface antigen